MDTQKRIRIYFTGVGGQGSLTATSLLARTALYAGCDVAGALRSLTSAKLTSCSALSLWKPCAACPISEATALSSRALTPCPLWV